MTWRVGPRSGVPARTLALCVIIAVSLGTVGSPPSAAARSAGAPGHSAAPDMADLRWIWPVASFRMERPYEAPAHRYGSGHRGVDLRPVDTEQLRAPAGGSIAFAGDVAGRGILTIDHGEGLVTTLEPIDSPLAPGAAVQRGEVLGTVALGGHTTQGAIHFGVRLRGEYINPLLLLGGIPRAVLLPCC